ncbi:uncharacterized protein LOC129171108 [Dunckerocampus dactyliophorus]|uniref:uncharacterized protein LOC129171108 n=1 Tax=Dunckerocampus dactyliophorus TaxID=161453 RepID=UPI0024065580|nr:uncharacterized protein LOC129171108 [Dunckerocampus dactyliophorus]
MTLAALLCVYWICVLLLSDSAASSVKRKGYQYRSNPDTQNLEDDDNPFLDEHDWEDTHTSYVQGEQQPQWGESSQNQPQMFGGPGADDLWQHKMTTQMYRSPGHQPSNPQQSVDKPPFSYQHPRSGSKNPNRACENDVSANTGDNHLVFEKVFQFPPCGLSQQHLLKYPPVQGRQPHAYPAKTGWPYGFPRDNRQVPSWLELQLAVQEDRKPHLPPSSIAQSRSHYRKGRYTFTRDRYTQNVDHPLIYH